MPQITNNTRKVYSLRLVPVVPLCGLQIEVIEGFRKGLMQVFQQGGFLPLRKGYIGNVMVSSIVILMGLSKGAFRVTVSTCQRTCMTRGMGDILTQSKRVGFIISHSSKYYTVCSTCWKCRYNALCTHVLPSSKYP